jgi:hypothetical protein
MRYGTAPGRAALVPERAGTHAQSGHGAGSMAALRQARNPATRARDRHTPGGLVEAPADRRFIVVTVPAAAGFPAVDAVMETWAADVSVLLEWGFSNAFGPKGEPLNCCQESAPCVPVRTGSKGERRGTSPVTPTRASHCLTWSAPMFIGDLPDWSPTKAVPG